MPFMGDWVYPAPLTVNPTTERKESMETPLERYPIRVQTHIGGEQTLHVGRYRVEWQPFGGYYVVVDFNGFVLKRGTQADAILAARMLLEKTVNPTKEER